MIQSFSQITHGNERPLAMSAELVGILSVGATLIVGGLATAGAVVGLILKIEGRLSGRMVAMEERLSARMDRMDARMDRMDARMDTLESRQYEIVQVVVRMEATQQAMLETLARVEERTRPASDRPAQPPPFETGSAPSDDPRQAAPASAPTPV